LILELSQQQINSGKPIQQQQMQPVQTNPSVVIMPKVK
jgi:hypothetical protein